ncbi:DUF3592 domain-containing protein [bacterium]|nr:DUF3592 domain-containing protein [bacterium]
MTDKDSDRKQHSSDRNILSWIVLIAFAAIWVAVTVGIDFAFIGPILRQIPTCRFISTTGVITRSNVSIDHGVDFTAFRVVVNYDYQVQGKNYSGNRYRYGNHGSSSSEYAERYVKTHPPGTPVEVYFNPVNFSDSVLIRGIEGADIFLPLFLLPFNVPMLAISLIIIHAFVRWTRGQTFFEEEVETFVDEVGQFRVRMPHTVTAMGKACYSLMFAPIIVCVPTVFLFGFHPPLWVALGLWSVVVAMALRSALKRKYALNAGHFDLTINPVAKTVRLPFVTGGKEPIEWPWKHVRYAELKKCISKDSESGGNTESMQIRLCSIRGEDELVTEIRHAGSEIPNRIAHFLWEQLGTVIIRTELNDSDKKLSTYRVLTQV